jgi:hypothetical protein
VAGLVGEITPAGRRPARARARAIQDEWTGVHVVGVAYALYSPNWSDARSFVRALRCASGYLHRYHLAVHYIAMLTRPATRPPAEAQHRTASRVDPRPSLFSLSFVRPTIRLILIVYAALHLTVFSRTHSTHTVPATKRHHHHHQPQHAFHRTSYFPFPGRTAADVVRRTRLLISARSFSPSSSPRSESFSSEGATPYVPITDTEAVELTIMNDYRISGSTSYCK